MGNATEWFDYGVYAATATYLTDAFFPGELGTLGTMLGFAISFGICAAFPKLGLTDYVGDPKVSPPVALITTLILGAIGVVAGYFPAREAARLDPVVAMKM